MQAMIMTGLHRVGHLANHGHAKPVLERPHASGIKKGYAVAFA